MIEKNISSEYDEVVLNAWPLCRSKAVGFAMSLRNSEKAWEFKISHKADKPIVIASATAALMLGFLNALDVISQADKTRWSKYLLNSLGEDGLCSDETDLSEPTQTQPMWALRAHRTRHIAWAIELLGVKLEKPFEITKPLCVPGGAKKWLDELLAGDIPGGFWAAGNWIMDMAVLLDLEYRHFGNTHALTTLNELLDGLDDLQDENTGYWFAPGDDLRCAMAGAMHLYPIYWAYGRELKHRDKIMATTLSLQQPDGLFSYEVGEGGSQCLDYDAVLVLCNIAANDDKWRGAVAESCSNVLCGIMVNQNANGSFSDCRRDEDRFWATKAAIYRCNEGSLWDTYARLMTIAMCIKCIYGDYPDGMTAEHHWFEIFEGGCGWDARRKWNSLVH